MGIFECIQNASRWIAKVPLPDEFPLRWRTGARGQRVISNQSNARMPPFLIFLYLLIKFVYGWQCHKLPRCSSCTKSQLKTRQKKKKGKRWKNIKIAKERNEFLAWGAAMSHRDKAATAVDFSAGVCNLRLRVGHFWQNGLHR